MRLRIMWMGWIAWGLAGLCITGPATAENEPPLMEDYVFTGEVEQYAQTALLVLQSSPQSPHAPRLAYDVMMLGRLAGNETLVQEMQRILLFNYPRSVHTQYFIHSFTDKGAFRQLYVRAMTADLMANPAGFRDRFVLSLRTVLQRQGNDILADEAMLLKAAVIAETTQDADLRASLLRASQQSPFSERLAPVRDICLDMTRTPTEKIIALTPMLEQDTSRFIARIYITSLGEDNQKNVDVIRAAAAIVMIEGKFGEAMQLIQSLPEEATSDRDIYWLGVCAAAQGEFPAARRRFDELLVRFPDSEWTNVADKLIHSFDDIEPRYRAYGQHIAKAVQQARPGLQSVELHGTLTPRVPAGHTYDLYFGAVRGSRFATVIRQDGQLALALDDRITEASMFTRELGRTVRFQQGGALPEVQLELQGSPATGFSMNLGFNVRSQRFEDAPLLLANMVASPYMADAEGVIDQLRYHQSKARFALPVQEQDGIVTLEWITPNVLQPRLQSTQLNFDDNRLVAARFGHTHLTTIRYSTASDLELAVPAWPQQNIIEQPRITLSTTMQVLAQITQLLATGR